MSTSCDLPTLSYNIDFLFLYRSTYMWLKVKELVLNSDRCCWLRVVEIKFLRFVHETIVVSLNCYKFGYIVTVDSFVVLGAVD